MRENRVISASIKYAREWWKPTGKALNSALGNWRQKMTSTVRPEK